MQVETFHNECAHLELYNLYSILNHLFFFHSSYISPCLIRMNYILLLVLFSLLPSLSDQSYSYCGSSYSYFYNSNGALCCYRNQYYYYYYYYYSSYYYIYCPYYTYATTTPIATTSLSNYCSSYYYSSYYSSRCCYKSVRAYNYYYSSNYYYTTRDCDLDTTTIATTTQAPSSCSYYYYSNSYGTKCCTFRDYSYYSTTYDQYCPRTSTLSSQCGTSCCSAYVPVYNGYQTFYYSQYFCPDNNSHSYCGSFCGMAATFGTLGICCCICGLGFTITFSILFALIAKKKKETQFQVTQPDRFRSVSTDQPDTAGLQYSTIEMKQIWPKESLPPQIPGYIFNDNPVNTIDIQRSPQKEGATNITPNPVFVPSSHIET